LREPLPPVDLPDEITLRFATGLASAPPLLAELSEEERARAASFGSEKRRRAFALGRATARRLLAEQLGVPPGIVPLAIAPDGAVEVPGLHLSLAHTATESRTVAVAAAGPRPLGVDVEVLRPRRPDLYRFLLHPEEYPLLDLLPHGPELAPVVLWALKEAVLKAQRTGFRISPKQLRLTLDPEGAPSGTVRVEGGGVWAVRYAEWEGCALAVAFPTP
jgi:4'-phosphopantetheinyl transferase